MRPFTVSIDDAVLTRITNPVRDFEWPADPGLGDWSLGTETSYLREFQRYWLEQYVWRKAERELNRFPQFHADVDGLEMHFLHVRGSGPSPMPLLLLHGWPGSTLEFHGIIDALAHPERFGGDPAASFDVIVPSLPGYGFSGKPAAPIGPRKTAQYMNALMVRVLDHDRYFVQGGDWGCLIGGWMAFDHPAHVAAFHQNMIGLVPGGDMPGIFGSMSAAPETPEEIAWAQDTAIKFAREGGYVAQQSTRPQTLGYGMNDSPMGVAAWILEKFHAWSDLDAGSLDDVFGKETLLTNIMIYLVTRSFNTSTWMYHGAANERIALPRAAASNSRSPSPRSRRTSSPIPRAAMWRRRATSCAGRTCPPAAISRRWRRPTP